MSKASILDLSLRHITLYPGSFDPLHIGHTALAHYVLGHTESSEVWFLPTPQNPYKSYRSALPYALRCACIQEAIASEPQFRLCTIENHLPYPHYTVRTLQALSTLYPNFRFSLLMGSDNWASIQEWYQSERITQGYPLLVYPRKGFSGVMPKAQERVTILDEAPTIEVSSTMIREGIREGKDLSSWLASPQLYPQLCKAIIHQS